jgi:hypothetical protein
MVCHSEGKTLEEIHPHWLSLRPRLGLKKLHEHGQLPCDRTNQVIFADEADTYFGVEWIDLDSGEVIPAYSAMRAQQFPLYLGDLFSELLTVLLFERVEMYFHTRKGSVPARDVEERLADWKKRYRFASTHSSGNTKVNFSLSLVDGCLR